MTWNEIYDTVIEIQQLIEEIKIKYNSKAIREILDRYNKYYCVEINFNINSLKDAVLETKIKNSVIQSYIINKINPELLSIEDIFSHLPCNLSECEQHVNSLKEKYEAVNNCIDLVLEIESLAEIEYETDKDFKDTEYGKMINYQNKLYEKTLEKAELLNPIYLSAPLTDYFNTLTDKEKETLLLESVSLSYNRNCFDVLNKMIMIYNTQKTLIINPEEAKSYYKIYKGLVKSLLLKNYIVSPSLFEISKTLKLPKNSIQKKK